MSLITLEKWNDAMFDGRYAINTLRSWARNGYISPASTKVGRDWLVEHSSQFRKPKKAIDIPGNVDISIMPTDPVVLSILNKAA